MKIPCILCDTSMDTSKGDIYVTVSWVLQDLLEKNNVECDVDLPRVVKVCETCWEAFKEKPKQESCFWIYDKKV